MLEPHGWNASATNSTGDNATNDGARGVDIAQPTGGEPGENRDTKDGSQAPLLAGYLRDIPGSMERIGSGIRCMMHEMQALQLPPPECTEHYDLVVTFRNGQPLLAHDDLGERQKKALEMVRISGSISTSECCLATGTSASTGLRDLTELVEKELLVARGKRRAKRFYLP